LAATLPAAGAGIAAALADGAWPARNDEAPAAQAARAARRQARQRRGRRAAALGERVPPQQARARRPAVARPAVALQRWLG
jgi:hypothetical protein